MRSLGLDVSCESLTSIPAERQSCVSRYTMNPRRAIPYRQRPSEKFDTPFRLHINEPFIGIPVGRPNTFVAFFLIIPSSRTCPERRYPPGPANTRIGGLTKGGGLRVSSFGKNPDHSSLAACSLRKLDGDTGSSRPGELPHRNNANCMEVCFGLLPGLLGAHRRDPVHPQ